MIAYFDTSAVIPLVIGEPSSATCARMWNEAVRSISVRLLCPEARAALTRAERMGRVTRRQHAAALVELDAIVTEIDHVEITAEPARNAGDLARELPRKSIRSDHKGQDCGATGTPEKRSSTAPSRLPSMTA